MNRTPHDEAKLGAALRALIQRWREEAVRQRVTADAKEAVAAELEHLLGDHE